MINYGIDEQFWWGSLINQYCFRLYAEKRENQPHHKLRPTGNTLYRKKSRLSNSEILAWSLTLLVVISFYHQYMFGWEVKNWSARYKLAVYSNIITFENSLIYIILCLYSPGHVLDITPISTCFGVTWLKNIKNTAILTVS